MLTTALLKNIRPPYVTLRDIDKDSEEYQGLLDAIRENGFVGAITVRPQTDSETNEEFLEVVDGYHRFEACRDAGLTEINVDIREMTDDEVLFYQVILNLHQIQTTPMQYSQHLLRILENNPEMSEKVLAVKIARSIQWLRERLKLNQIEDEQIIRLIDTQEICVSNAVALAKLPIKEQSDWLDKAINLTPMEFIPLAHARAKEVKEAKLTGKVLDTTEFRPPISFQKMKNVKFEIETPAICKELIELTGITTPEEGFIMGLQWVLHLDVISIQMAKDKFERIRKSTAKKLEKIKKLEEELL